MTLSGLQVAELSFHASEAKMVVRVLWFSFLLRLTGHVVIRDAAVPLTNETVAVLAVQKFIDAFLSR